jgi:hypothetical protein
MRIFKRLTYSLLASVIFSFFLMITACGEETPQGQQQGGQTKANIQEKGPTYYVSPDGNDSNTGSINSPWMTIEHAADLAEAGGTVYIRGGVYNEAPQISKGGKADAVLTIAAYPGETPVLDGSNHSLITGITITQGVSYLKLDGLHFVNFRMAGVVLDGSNSNIELDNLDCSGAENGLRMTWGESGGATEFGSVDHITIAGGSYHDNQLGVDCTPGPCDNLTLTNVRIENNGVGTESYGADGLGVEMGSPILLDGVQSINNGGDGIDLNSRDKRPVEGILVRNSVIGNNQLMGVKLWAGGRLENSIIYGCGGTPLQLARFSGTSTELVNNTVAYNMWDPAYAGRDYSMTVGYYESGEEQLENAHLTLINNIFAFNGGPDVGGPTGIYLGTGVDIKESNNLFFSRDDCEIEAHFTPRECYAQSDITGGVWSADTSQGIGDIIQDPLFIDPEGHDFHLRDGSPALDAGTPESAPPNDLDGKPRPQGAGYCIGALE